MPAEQGWQLLLLPPTLNVPARQDTQLPLVVRMKPPGQLGIDGTLLLLLLLLLLLEEKEGEAAKSEEVAGEGEEKVEAELRAASLPVAMPELDALMDARTAPD